MGLNYFGAGQVGTLGPIIKYLMAQGEKHPRELVIFLGEGTAHILFRARKMHQAQEVEAVFTIHNSPPGKSHNKPGLRLYFHLPAPPCLRLPAIHLTGPQLNYAGGPRWCLCQSIRTPE